MKLQHLITRPFDAVTWGDIVAQDIHVRIGNAPPIIGKADALAELERFFARVASMGAGYWESCTRRESIFAEVEVDFINDDGCECRIPCMIMARMEDGRLLDLRFGLDPSPIPSSPPETRGAKPGD
jgi:hypothetical protein